MSFQHGSWLPPEQVIQEAKGGAPMSFYYPQDGMLSFLQSSISHKQRLALVNCGSIQMHKGQDHGGLGLLDTGHHIKE